MQLGGRGRLVSWVLFMVAACTPGCAPAASDELPPRPRELIETAVTYARQRGSFRVRGELRTTVPAMVWEGVVVGTDEQAKTRTAGLVIESRRVGGRSWGRRADGDGSWMEVAYDGPIDLGVLLQGDSRRIDRQDDGWSITLDFHGVDILRALTHVPSTGATTATVTLHDDTIAQVTLELPGAVTARLDIWDYGGPVAVEPVEIAGLDPLGGS
jgi:hypothetical protein